jgi:tetratricopeptide (TPR) repeat protein
MGCDVASNPPARPRATLPIVTSRARPSLRSSASLTRGQSIISACTAYLAAAQEREGAIVDALETVEQALEANPHELVSRPEILRLRGELRLKQGDTELAEADFRNSVALARTMGESLGVAHDDQPRAAARQTRSLARSARDAHRNLQLVHRGLRHCRLEGCENAAGGTGYITPGAGRMRCLKCGAVKGFSHSRRMTVSAKARVTYILGRA